MTRRAIVGVAVLVAIGLGAMVGRDQIDLLALETWMSGLGGWAPYTWLGYAGRHAVAGDATAIQYGLAAFGLLAAIALLPRLVRRLRAAPSQWLEPAGLEHQRRASAPPSVIDVRGPDEFAGPLGKIPGARNVPVDEIAARLPELESLRNGPVVLVCKTDKRSARAAEILRAAGFQATVLRGGMEAWNASHLPVEKATAAPPQADVS